MIHFVVHEPGDVVGVVVVEGVKAPTITAAAAV